ncbi:hypothetical protein [Halopseudomonas laoshanensis]|uniref:hypothetical protein n=1 Tax=Halopseudomonas laoshanensis TaxID=2268758 RepID=UPI00373657FD
MESQIGFASQGELLKAIFDAFGILPRKEHPKDLFDEKEKKTLQKRLKRLANEEGGLGSNFGEGVVTLSSLLSIYLPDMTLMSAIGDVLSDVQEAYVDLLRTEGTYLSKGETIRYFISIRAVPLLVMSLHRSILLYRPDTLWLKTPADRFWYLPTIDAEGQVTLPLEKVMRWAYEVCGTSQTQFHFPGKNATSENARLQNNLDNAVNWTRGSHLPALPGLLRNFSESFSAMSAAGQEIPNAMKVSILANLVLSRFSSYVFREITKAYGVEYLREICAQFRSYDSYIELDVGEFYREIAPVISTKATKEDQLATWAKAAGDYWSFLTEKVVMAQEELQQAYDPYRGLVSEGVIDALTRKYGAFAVQASVDPTHRKKQFQPPDCFFQMLGLGFELKRDGLVQWEQIESYAADIENHSLGDHLGWLVAWIRAAYFYRREEYATAMPHYQQAFDLGKYRAGKSQYDLVNQYVEVAAKNGKNKCFKNGVGWAQYLQVPIRWLRDDEPTDEKLDMVFYMLKIARYDHQL